MERPGDPQEVQLLKGQRRHFVPVTPLHFALRCFGGSLGLGGDLGESLWAARGLGRSCDLMESPHVGRRGCCLYHPCPSSFLRSNPEPLGWCLRVGRCHCEL